MSETNSIYFGSNTFRLTIPPDLMCTERMGMLDFGALGRNFHLIKRFEIQTAKLLYAVDISNGLDSRLVTSQPAFDNFPWRCTAGFPAVNARHHSQTGRCLQIREVIDKAAVAGKSGLGTEELEAIINCLLWEQ
jgi:hypothetical protein